MPQRELYLKELEDHALDLAKKHGLGMTETLDCLSELQWMVEEKSQMVLKCLSGNPVLPYKCQKCQGEIVSTFLYNFFVNLMDTFKLEVPDALLILEEFTKARRAEYEEKHVVEMKE